MLPKIENNILTKSTSHDNEYGEGYANKLYHNENLLTKKVDVHKE